MRVLFLARHYGYFRSFEAALQLLAERGHDLHLAVERDDALGGRLLVERLAAASPRVTFGEAPVRSASDEWGWAAAWLRLGIDYFRYQHPIYDDAGKLRERATERTPRLFTALASLPGTRRFWRSRLTTVLRRLERAVPEEPAIVEYLRERRPDVLLITPLIDLGSSQIDYLRAARAAGIPTVLCVWSWDHLSSKALIRELPQRVLVWNDVQKREAVELHGVPADRVIVTGAQCFDRWFDRRPSRDRAEFCREVGLPADRPFVLYVCSALFGGSPSEALFVLEWIRRLRASGAPSLAGAGILVRPHPSRVADWEGRDLSGLGPVRVWGGNPVDAQSQADYFDSLHHSAAVVGLNTSAFIEAAIAGRPVHTILHPDFHDNQMGTLHFRYLRDAGGGLLIVARDFDEHCTQLAASLDGRAGTAEGFVRAFVRPHGLDRAGTPAFVAAVESAAGDAVDPETSDALQPLWQTLLSRLADVRERRMVERWVLSDREYASVDRLRSVGEAKRARRERLVAEREAAKRAAAAARERRQAEAAARQEREAQERARIRAAREAARAAEATARARREAEHRAAKEARVAARQQEKERNHAAKRSAQARRRRRAAVRQRLGSLYRAVVRTAGGR